MKPSSCKAKGRRFQQEIAGMIRETFSLPDPDAVSTGMGQQGIDIQLSTAAREKIPYAIECKNTEHLNIWEALKQCEENAKKELLKPALCFTRNRTPVYVAIPFSEFLELVKK